MRRIAHRSLRRAHESPLLTSGAPERLARIPSEAQEASALIVDAQACRLMAKRSSLSDEQCAI